MLPVNWGFPNSLGGDANHFHTSNQRILPRLASQQRSLLRCCLRILSGTPIAPHGRRLGVKTGGELSRQAVQWGVGRKSLWLQAQPEASLNGLKTAMPCMWKTKPEPNTKTLRRIRVPSASSAFAMRCARRCLKSGSRVFDSKPTWCFPYERGGTGAAVVPYDEPFGPRNTSVAVDPHCAERSVQNAPQY